MVKVYSINECPWCKKVKTYLDQKGVDYQEINVEEDEQGYQAMLNLSKQRNVPVIEINNDFVVGFDLNRSFRFGSSDLRTLCVDQDSDLVGNGSDVSDY